MDCTGPAFAEHADQRSVALEMLARGLTSAVVFDEHGNMDQPSSVFRKRSLLVHRCSLRRDNPELEPMMRGAAALLASEGITTERGPLPLLEVSVAGDDSTNPASTHGFRASVDRVFQPGHASMLTNCAETFRVSTCLRRYSADPIRFVFGLDSVVTILREHVYKEIGGGVLEGLGRLLTPNTKLYAFSMAADTLRERLKLHNVEPGFWSAPAKPLLTADDLTLAGPAGHLLEFIKSAGWVMLVEAIPK